jgi:2-aminoethylphosphonate-pyruvate transaminase
MKKQILLNPGPTNILGGVKNIQTKYTEVCHRTDAFHKVYENLKEKLLFHFAREGTEKWKIAILAGSGTTALESMIVSLLPDNSHVINAGKYGERAINILQSYNIPHTSAQVSNILDVQRTEDTNVYFVQNETTTGELFSLEEMTKRNPSAKLYIDATSAFGAFDYTPYLDNIAAISFCSNKCLQAPAGLAFVIYNEEILLQNRPKFTLDVSLYENKMPFTIPPQLIAALSKALDLEDSRERRFNARRDRIIKDMNKIGIRCVNECPSNSIIGFQHPYMKYHHLQKILSNKGIVIYSGIPDVARSFRLSTMSTLFDDKYDYIMECFNETCIC